MSRPTADEVGVRYFCVAYRPLQWALPRFVEPISVGPCGPDVTDLGEQYPEWVGQDAVLGEYAALFALRRALEAEGPIGDGGMLGIAHYRRFAMTGPVKVSSRRGEAIRPTDFAKLSRDRFLPPAGTIMHLLPIAVSPSLVGQYGHHHHTRDLLFFMGLAVDMGVLTDAEAGAWLGGAVLVPAATVGVFPRDWWISTMTALEAVVRAYLEQHAVERMGYQRRTPAFCLERLHSLLLVKLVQSWPAGQVLAHPELIVDPTGRYQGNIGEG